MLRLSRPLRVSLVACLLAGVGLLSSCGGGVSDVASNTSGGSGSGGVGSGGTGSYTSGTISGLGSIIVNGVRYDVSQASVIDDEGRTSYRTDVLDIGMTVEVTGGPASTPVGASRPTAAAAQVRFASALVGPVEVAPDAGCSCLTVLGQKVTYGVGTNQPSTLHVGDVVEVFGRPDLARRELVASRIALVTDGRPYKLQGWVTASGAVDTANHTVSVYGPSQPPGAEGSVPLVLGYADSELVEPLTEARSGVRAVRVWFSPERALRKLALERPLATDESEAKLAGLVTDTRNEQGMLAINGTWVDASAMSSTTAAQLTLGTLVLVEGRLVNGVLVVNEVHLGGSEEHEDDELEVHGRSSEVTPLEGGSQATMVVIHDSQRIPVVFNLSDAPALSVLQGGVCVQVHSSGYDAQGRLVATEVEVERESSCH